MPGDPEGIPPDLGADGKTLVESAKAYDIVYFHLWVQGPPRHYTYLKLYKTEGHFRVQYKD